MDFTLNPNFFGGTRYETNHFTPVFCHAGVRPSGGRLRAGCCPDPVPGPDGQAGRHLIRGLEFKTATDEHGNHRSAGTERTVPWVAITPVVNAIRVLERMVPDGHLLFDHHAHDLASTRPGTGSSFSLLTAENATGNWVKVTQRVPVRIRITDADPAMPLRVGTSATITVDTTSLSTKR